MVAKDPRDDANADVVSALERIEHLLNSIRIASVQPPREWLTIQEVADELRVSRDTIERLVLSGRLKATEISTGNGAGLRHRFRIRRDWINDFLTTGIVDNALMTQPRRKRQNKTGMDFIGD